MTKTVFYMFLFMAVAMLADTALAETYTWVDGAGTMHFTDNPSTIPNKYRRKTAVRESIENDGSYRPPADEARPQPLSKATPDPEIEKKANKERRIARLKEILKGVESDLELKRDRLKNDRVADNYFPRSGPETVRKMRERRPDLQDIERMEKHVEELKSKIAELQR